MLLAAYEAAREALPAYSHRFSPKKFTQHQLVACLVLKEFLRADYRGLAAHLADHSELTRLIGLEAGTLRRWSLARRGWTTLGTVSGRTQEDCERRFFDMWLSTQPRPSPAAPSDAAPTAGARRSLLGSLFPAKA